MYIILFPSIISKERAHLILFYEEIFIFKKLSKFMLEISQKLKIT